MNARWLECAYIIGDYIPMDSLSYVYQKNSEHDIKFLLSILNSKLMNKYYRFCYTDVNVKPTYLNQLPIPDISIDNQQPFVSLVNQILAIKQVNPNGDTTALEQEI
ncbi:MAG: TaqI-like C-terminal specificity domain-containing protein, partial [Dolichospermum sp.]